MQLRSYLISFLALVLLSNCASVPLVPPAVTLCILDPAHNSLQCFSPADQHRFSRPIDEAANFVCMAPGDFRSLLIYLSSLEHQ
jgi:hypothetical protein